MLEKWQFRPKSEFFTKMSRKTHTNAPEASNIA